MSKMGNIHLQAQEDARDGMDLSRFLDEYGDDALKIWEEFNGSVEEDIKETQSIEAKVMKHQILKEIDDFMSGAPDYDDEFYDERKKSYYWLSTQPQTDEEIQTEHWNDDRKITDF